VDLTLFTDGAPGDLVDISGTDPRHGEWAHKAFVPHPLPYEPPALTPATYRVVGNCRAALAALDSTARRLPNPRLFRRPALHAEAQSTSALEGTYAPLAEILIADEDRPPSVEAREILNYVAMADVAFEWVEDGRPLTVGLLADLQAILVRRTRAETSASGNVRSHHVVIGRRTDHDIGDAPVYAARFVPSPPGLDLRANLQGLLDWMSDEAIHRQIDPVVASALSHYQFETLHPFHDGNGRIGRLLIVLHLLKQAVLSEPTLTVSPWFERRRDEYYDHLFSVSTEGAWDAYVRFFATGLEASARSTHERMLVLVDVQNDLKERVRRSKLRADTAQSLVDYAVANTSFTVRSVEKSLKISYGRANGLVAQLVELGVLSPVQQTVGGSRRFFAPDVFRVVVGARTT
jgi:Fic family protein